MSYLMNGTKQQKFLKAAETELGGILGKQKGDRETW